MGVPSWSPCSSKYVSNLFLCTQNIIFVFWRRILIFSCGKIRTTKYGPEHFNSHFPSIDLNKESLQSINWWVGSFLPCFSYWMAFHLTLLTISLALLESVPYPPCLEVVSVVLYPISSQMHSCHDFLGYLFHIPFLNINDKALISCINFKVYLVFIKSYH